DSIRAIARLRENVQAVMDMQAEMDRMLIHLLDDPRTDPSFRLVRNEALAQFQTAWDAALREAFILTRSLEYELNSSLPARATLFSRTTPSQLEAYVNSLDSEHSVFVAAHGHAQPRSTTISLRDDVLRLSSPLVDDVTGHVYTPQERFRKYLSEGRQRDSDGNLQLSFALSLDGDESLFNPSLCVDRISGLRVSLVGVGLGAVQPELILEQRGGAFLRS